MLSFACTALAASEIAASLVPQSLRCECLVDPVGIDVRTPMLSWKVVPTSAKARNLAQTAYRVLVASDPEILNRDEGDLWDSGRVESSNSTAVAYGGKTLTSEMMCWWKVKVWDQDGKDGDWSKPAKWSMGLLEPGDWKAKWIGYDEPLKKKTQPIEMEGAEWVWSPEDPEPAPAATRFFRTTFNLEEPKGRKLFLAAGDQCTVYINGVEAAKSDGRPDAWQRPLTIDLGRHGKKGENTIAVKASNETPGRAGLIAKLDDGTFTTSSSWKTAQQEEKGWQNPGHNDGAWKSAKSLGQYGVEPWGKLDSGLFTPPPRMLRQEFYLAKPIKRATLYCSAKGLYDVKINGKQANDDFFMPGWSVYEKRIYYRAYDVTRLLKKGPNAVAALLGDGWYAGYVGFGKHREHYGEKTRFLAQINVEYADGTVGELGTDEDWRAATGPTLEADFLMGETYDAALDKAGWDKPDYDDSRWARPDADERLDVPLKAFPGVPVRAYQTLKAKSIAEPVPGVYVIDLGQNMAGVPLLKVKGKKGQKITLRFAERLNPDRTVYVLNLRSARATDTYFCKGTGKLETWMPKFTFHGFQYIEITGLDERPTKDTVAGVALSSDTPNVGKFECSDRMLNKLWSNAWWTQRMNFIDIPTDCPQRDERLGWTGDAQAYIRTACLNNDVQAFFIKWLEALNDSQREDGQFPMVAPLKVAGDDGGPAWADAGVICPWALYSVYGDKRTLAECYPAMVKFIEFCKNRSKPELLPPDQFHCFGDWLSIGAETPTDVIFQAYFAHSTELTARAAEALGKPDDAKKLWGLHAKIKESFNRAYVDKDGRVKGDTQCAYTLALAFDLLDGVRRERAAQRLAEDIIKHGTRLTTGFVGTRDIMHALAKIGRFDLAYELLHSTKFPSWGFTIQNGATTIWERWNGWTPEQGFADPGMNSFAHYAFGAVIQWVYEHVGGIQVGKPGYETFSIKPQLDPKLTWAKTSYDSIRGPIACDWRVQGSRLVMNVTVPANTRATVWVPTSDPSSVRLDGKATPPTRTETGWAVFELGSGNYAFEAKQ